MTDVQWAMETRKSRMEILKITVHLIFFYYYNSIVRHGVCFEILSLEQKFTKITVTTKNKLGSFTVRKM